jgi:hypothetical protein
MEESWVIRFLHSKYISDNYKDIIRNMEVKFRYGINVWTCLKVFPVVDNELS